MIRVFGKNAELCHQVAFQATQNPLFPSDLSLCLDSIPGKQLVKLLKVPKRKRILIHFEPRVVEPKAYSYLYRRLFCLELIMGGTKYCDPVWPIDLYDTMLNKSRLCRAAMVQANKFSAVKGELYSLRRKVIDRNLVDFFGPGWERKALQSLWIIFKTMIYQWPWITLDYQNIRSFIRSPRPSSGVVEDKIAIQSQYKVAVVIENSLEMCTEKIFEAFKAGSIPVYVGPDIPEATIPSALYVRAEPNLSSIESRIQFALGLSLTNFHEYLASYVSGNTLIRKEKSFEVMATQIIEHCRT